MDLETAATRLCDSEGVPGGALAAATVGQESGTVAAPPRPAMPYFDASRYDLRETVVGDMVVQVYTSPGFSTDRDQRGWWYEVSWRGEVLAAEMLWRETTREGVELLATQRARDLVDVVRTVSHVVAEDFWTAFTGVSKGLWPTRPPAGKPTTWVALPDDIVEPRA